jgi:hypothetical protein
MAPTLRKVIYGKVVRSLAVHGNFPAGRCEQSPMITMVDILLSDLAQVILPCADRRLVWQRRTDSSLVRSHRPFVINSVLP